ncbi:MAG: type II toxin-antitoxin system VapC family toxin [Schwartzia sp.]|jgi:tRNA(fMet)-specific endonuclease VapC|nr:type II toxin-antitoxin system VapC family toxin [Schwartzia sp. (in: firmicutes)]
MYLIDTNICIYAMKGLFPAMNRRLIDDREQIFVSSVTVGELEYGATKSRWSERTRQIFQAFLANYIIVPFDENDAIVFGKIRAQLATNGTPIGAYDAMIGAQGVARNLTVVTHNTKEFRRIPGLLLEDWTV